MPWPRARSRALQYNALLPLKIDYRTLLDYIAVRDCRRLTYFPSFSFPLLTNTCSVLVFIASAPPYKYHRPTSQHSRQPRPITLSLSRVRLFSVSFRLLPP